MRIISRILLFLAPLLLNAAPLKGLLEVKIDQRSLEAEKAAAELYELNQQLNGLFRNGRHGDQWPVRIVLTGAVPPGEAAIRRLSDGTWQLEFDAGFPEWGENRMLRRRITGFLIAAKLGTVSPANATRLPMWVAAGTLHRLRAKRGSARLLRRNQDFPITRPLLSSGEGLPDFRAMTALPETIVCRKGVIQEWYDELSRLLLESLVEAARRNRQPLSDYVEGAFTVSETPERRFDRLVIPVLTARAERTTLPMRIGLAQWNYLPPPVKVQRYIEFFAGRFSFNGFFPQPVRELAKRFAIFRTLMLPKRDAKPGEPPQYHDLAELPELLRDRHPGAEAALSRKLKELNLTIEGGDVEFRQAFFRLGEAMTRMLAEPDSPPRSVVRDFQRELIRIPEMLEHRSAVEERLMFYERQFRSPWHFYQSAIRECEEQPNGETPALRRLLDRAEAAFLEE